MELVDVACCVLCCVVVFLFCVRKWDVPQSVRFIACADGVGIGWGCGSLFEVNFVFGEGDLHSVVAELS